MPRLQPHEFAPFLSPYLMGGWREDEVVVDSIDVEPGRIRGVVHATDYFKPSDGVYHLTVPSVFIWVAQLAIIYGCWDQHLAKKPGEIFIRDIQLKCKRPVTTPRGIEFVLRLGSRRAVTDGVFYRGGISVQRDAFVGEASFVLPLPARSASRRSDQGAA